MFHVLSMPKAFVAGLSFQKPCEKEDADRSRSSLKGFLLETRVVSVCLVFCTGSKGTSVFTSNYFFGMRQDWFSAASALTDSSS